MTAAEPAARSRRRLARLAVVAMLAAVNVAWNLTAQVSPASFPTSERETPLRLTRVRWTWSADRDALRVEITLRNLDPRRRRGLVWWQLAPEPASLPRQPPWPRRAYESRYLDADIDGNAEATFRWSEEPMVPPGNYEIHGWARYATGDSYRPSDGRQATPGTVAIRRVRPLLRYRPVPNDAAVTRVDAPSGGRTRGLVAVENLTDRVRHGWLRWTLSPADAGDVLYWWRWAGSTTAPRYREVDLLPGQETLVDLRGGSSPSPGSYALRVTLELDDVALKGGPGELAGDDVMAFIRIEAHAAAGADLATLTSRR